MDTLFTSRKLPRIHLNQYQEVAQKPEHTAMREKRPLQTFDSFSCLTILCKPLSNDRILNLSKLKANADYKLNTDYKLNATKNFKFSLTVEKYCGNRTKS